MDIAEAVDRLAEIHYKCLRSFSIMRTFRIVAHNGLAMSRDVFYEQAYRLPDDLEASGWFIPEKSKITTEFRARVPKV